MDLWFRNTLVTLRSWEK